MPETWQTNVLSAVSLSYGNWKRSPEELSGTPRCISLPGCWRLSRAHLQHLEENKVLFFRVLPCTGHRSKAVLRSPCQNGKHDKFHKQPQVPCKQPSYLTSGPFQLVMTTCHCKHYPFFWILAAQSQSLA